jgi:hypothetical protein
MHQLSVVEKKRKKNVVKESAEVRKKALNVVVQSLNHQVNVVVKKKINL